MESQLILSKLILYYSNFRYISFGFMWYDSLILAFLPKNAKNISRLTEKYEKFGSDDL